MITRGRAPCQATETATPTAGPRAWSARRHYDPAVVRIALISHNAGTPWNGPNLRCYYLAQALGRAGHAVDVISSSYFHKYIQLPAVNGAVTREQIGDATYHWVRTRPYRARGAGQVRNQFEFVAKAWLHRSRCLQGRPDAVIASSPHPFVSLVASRIARAADAPFVFEARDLWPKALMELGGYGSGHPYMRLLKWAEAHSVRRAQLVVSVKPGDRDYFEREYALEPERFACIPNGLDTHGWKVEELPESFERSMPSGGLVVGYVGAISSAYSFDTLTEAAVELQERAPEVRFAVVGSGDQLERRREEVRERGLSNLHFLGAVEPRLVPAVLSRFDLAYVGIRKADVYRAGISSNKLYEYMWAGKAILASYDTEHDPVAEAGCGITVPAEDPRAVVEGLMRLREMGAEGRAELGERGRRKVAESFNFDARARQYVTAIEAVR